MGYNKVMKNKAFTLVELLVVVAILGLLASIVFVSLSGARDKAKIAAGLQFESSVHHALGAYAVGIWDFDDQTANDTSGNNNNGTINGATFTTDTPSKKGYAMSFDGNDYVEILDNTSIDISGNLTISTWLKFPAGGEFALISKISNIYDAGNWAIIIGWGDKIALRFGSVNSDLSNDGKWHQVVGVHQGTTAYLYVDGKLIKTQATGAVSANNYNLYFGRANDGSGGYIGLIDNVRVYDQALSESQIKQLYVEGVGSHKNNLAEE